MSRRDQGFRSLIADDLDHPALLSRLVHYCAARPLLDRSVRHQSLLSGGGANRFVPGRCRKKTGIKCPPCSQERLARHAVQERTG